MFGERPSRSYSGKTFTWVCGHRFQLCAFSLTDVEILNLVRPIPGKERKPSGANTWQRGTFKKED